MFLKLCFHATSVQFTERLPSPETIDPEAVAWTFDRALGKISPTRNKPMLLGFSAYEFAHRRADSHKSGYGIEPGGR